MNEVIRNAFKALEDIDDTCFVSETKSIEESVLNKNIIKRPIAKKVDEIKNCASLQPEKDKDAETLIEAPISNLQPEYDSSKSFYNKAIVDKRDDGTEILYSYNTPVCKIDAEGNVTLLHRGYLGWSSSRTTLRHVREFLKQHGKEIAPVDEMAKMYKIEEVGLHEEKEEKINKEVNTEINTDKNSKEKSESELKENCKDIDKSFEKIDESFEEIAQELADACNETLHCNITADDIEINTFDNEEWALFVEGSDLGLKVLKFGAYSEYIDDDTRGPIHNNGREKEGTVELGKLFEEKLRLIIKMFDECNAENESIEECDKLTESKTVNLMNKDEVAEGKEILDNPDNTNTEQIVDVDAATVDELKDSYIGNVILQCPVCKTLLYKKPEALQKDEDSKLYNLEDECPHCGSNDGFELVGQVASMNVDAEKEDTDTTGKVEVNSEENSEPEEMPEENKKENSMSDIDLGDDEEETEKEHEDEEKEENHLKLESCDNFDTDKWNSLANKMLTEVYEDVKDFTTSNVSVNENDVIIEGLINFNDNTSKESKFIFKTNSLENVNNVILEGVNETLNKDSSFNLKALVKDNHLICESLDYKVVANNTVNEGSVHN